MRRRFTLLLAGIALFAATAVAQAQVYKVTLVGANENPPVNSPGTGTAVVTLNSTTHEMRVNATFGGLVAGTTAAHIHCCVNPPGNAGVATTTPNFVGFPLGVTSGTFDQTYNMTVAGTWNPAFITASGGTPAGAEAALLAGAAAGQPYLNIHSTTFPGGEIRGQLVRFTFASNTSLPARTAGAAAALDSLGAGTGATSNAIVTLALLPNAQQADAIDRLTPVASRGLLVTASKMMTSTFDQVGDRLDGLRSARAVPGENIFWLKGYGSENRQGLLDGIAGYKGDGWGIAAGADHQFESEWIIGAALSYADFSLEYRNQLDGSADDISATQISLYATRDYGDFYLDAIGAYARQNYETARNTGVTGIATGEYDGDQWGVRIGGGMTFSLADNLSLTPQARLDWDSVELDAYTETGAGPLALDVSSRSADRIRTSLGALLAFDTDIGGQSVLPYLRAYWNHDFENDGLDTDAAFAAGGARFVTPGQELDDDTFTVGLGAVFHTGGAFSAAIAYDADLSDTYTSHLLQAKARWAF